MSEQTSFNNKKSLRPEEIIAIQDIVLEYIQSNDWKDYKGFARLLSEKIVRAQPKTETELRRAIVRLAHPFYSFNRCRSDFIKSFPYEQIIYRLSNIPKQPTPSKTLVIRIREPKRERIHVTFGQIFPEIEKVPITEARQLVSKLDMLERTIQDALRDALREKGATNMVERKSDSSLEVADLEDFTLKFGHQVCSFTTVVKGYRSISPPRVNWEHVAHQITNAFQGTKPDHIMLVLAKNPVDSLVTKLVEYGKSVGNRDLVILVDPVDLARFMHVRGII